MKNNILALWDRLRSSFWFLPAILVISAIVLALGMENLDQRITKNSLNGAAWIYTGGAEGASTILGAIASSMITLAGVVFSLTLVALTLASNQFGPHLLRNFMRSTINQIMIGTFVATFLYCLLVLRTIRRADEVLFIPHLSVTVGLTLALASVVMLIYFIHHVAISIQADKVIATVSEDLMDGIDRVFPEEMGQAGPNEVNQSGGQLQNLFEQDSAAVAARVDGYIQLIDPDALMALASTEDLLIRIERRPGHYVIAGTDLARVHPAEKVTDKLKARINAAFVFGATRTPMQDVEFAVDQIVEVALRALSPGTNDPFTAMTCIDRLGSALGRMGQRKIPSPLRFDKEKRLRVIASPVTFEAFADAALNQLRQHSRSNCAVTIRILDTLAQVAVVVQRPDDRAALRRHADMIARGARETLPEEQDRRDVEARHTAAIKPLTR